MAEILRAGLREPGAKLPEGKPALDFGRVLDTLGTFFDRSGFRYALAGAFAVSAYGMSRGTFDLDFVVPADAQSPVVAFLESLGYETLYRSAGYSNHLHSLTPFGRVDIVYVAGDTATQIFAQCRTMPGPGGRPVPVPRPEHLAAMKVQAMKNDPQRALRDLDDIRFLLQLPGIDENEIRGYFERAGLITRYEELKRLG